MPAPPLVPLAPYAKSEGISNWPVPPGDLPLRNFDSGEIDFVLVLESTEGLFSGRDSTFSAEDQAATNLMRISRGGAERV